MESIEKSNLLVSILSTSTNMERVCAPAMYPTATPTAALQNVHPIQNKINQLLWALSCTYCRYSSDLITFTRYGERERESVLFIKNDQLQLRLPK